METTKKCFIEVKTKLYSNDDKRLNNVTRRYLIFLDSNVLIFFIAYFMSASRRIPNLGLILYEKLNRQFLILHTIEIHFSALH